MSNNSTLCTPIMIAFASLVGAFILGLLAWGGRRMFNWCRTRIICKQRPEVKVYLVKRKGFKKPRPKVLIHILYPDISTRQSDGYYWLRWKLTTPGKPKIDLETERLPYKYQMPLDNTYTLKYIPTEPDDWSFWANKAELLKNSTLEVSIHINDRSKLLVKQIIDNIQFINLID